MIYFSHNSYISLLENLDYELLVMVDTDTSLFKYLSLCKKGEYGFGCLYEADDYFATYLKLSHGVTMYPLGVDDYKNLLRDNKVFLTKELSKRLRADWEEKYGGWYSATEDGK